MSHKRTTLFEILARNLARWRERRNAKELREQLEWNAFTQAYERNHNSKRRKYTPRITTMEAVTKLFSQEGTDDEQQGTTSAEDMVVEEAIQSAENEGMPF